MRRGFAVAGLCAAIAACQGQIKETSNDPVDIRALTWISASTDPVQHLTRQPESCLTEPNDPAVRRGELLFNSPLLLGGQAAKAGLSCASCHRNGRGNPDFVFSGISGAPGTADVTSGLFSKVRADQVFNPVIIPDLALPEGQKNVDRAREGTLEIFLAAQIVEEFSGEVPSSPIIADLASYLRALDADACDSDALKPQTWRDELGRLRAGGEYVSQPSAGSNVAYRSAMRTALGRLFERYPGREFDALRQAMVSLSRELGQNDVPDDLMSRLDDLESALAAGESQSLYDPNQLELALR